MQLYFCDKCQRRITERDIEKRSAVISGDKIYCAECVSSPELRAVLDVGASKKTSSKRKKARQRKTRSARRITPHSGVRAISNESSEMHPALFFLMFFALGVGLGFMYLGMVGI